MKDLILSIYLSVSVCLSIYLSVCSSVSIPIETGPHPTPSHPTLPTTPTPILTYTASIPIKIGPKRLRAEMTQGRNDSPERL